MSFSCPKRFIGRICLLAGGTSKPGPNGAEPYLERTTDSSWAACRWWWDSTAETIHGRTGAVLLWTASHCADLPTTSTGRRSQYVSASGCQRYLIILLLLHLHFLHVYLHTDTYKWGLILFSYMSYLCVCVCFLSSFVHIWWCLLAVRMPSWTFKVINN